MPPWMVRAVTAMSDLAMSDLEIFGTFIRVDNPARSPTPSPQWPGEAELMAVRVGQVEEPLAPLRIARCGVRSVAGGDHAGVERVDVGMVEDDPPPPGPDPLCGLGDEIEVAAAGPKARERGVVAAIEQLESQHAIEADRSRHVVGGQR